LDLLEALFLGVLQGATEFLPISSSGHLVLVPNWLGWAAPPLLFDVVVHLGTLVAVLAYFWRDWLTLLRAGWTALHTHSNQDAVNQDPQFHLLLMLGIGTIPAAVVGAVFNIFLVEVFATPLVASVALLMTACVLVLGERMRTGGQALTGITARQALLIGVAQAVAIIPGLSRSGSTISAGMWQGLARPDAARFSFLLSTPIILLAGGGQVLELLVTDRSVESGMLMVLLVGCVSAAVVGYLAIWLLMRLVQQIGLYGFAVYCATIGTLSLLVALFS
jgi:undecaprenyl-diphosphatase